jgi:alanine dehydrogenase
VRIVWNWNVAVVVCCWVALQVCRRPRLLFWVGGIAGANAVRAAIGLEANVACIDVNIQRLYQLDERFGAALDTVYSTRRAVEDYVQDADLVIGAALVPGAAAPRIISRDLVRAMKRGAVIVDISIDQGGTAETSRPTTHAQPTYLEEGVVHYCVTNMPGAVARTSTQALNNATLPFVLALADEGPVAALRADTHLRDGLSVHNGKLTCRAVAEALDMEWTDPLEALA